MRCLRGPAHPIRAPVRRLLRHRGGHRLPRRGPGAAVPGPRLPTGAPRSRVLPTPPWTVAIGHRDRGHEAPAPRGLLQERVPAAQVRQGRVPPVLGPPAEPSTARARSTTPTGAGRGSPIGRGSALKQRSVRVRLPLAVPASVRNLPQTVVYVRSVPDLTGLLCRTDEFVRSVDIAIAGGDTAIVRLAAVDCWAHRRQDGNERHPSNKRRTVGTAQTSRARRVPELSGCS
jgi:hypothetical protein